MKKIYKRIIVIASVIVVLCLLTSAGAAAINFNMISKTQSRIVAVDNIGTINDKFDCILVLGAGLWGDKPSPMLEDRLKVAIELYNNGVSNKILMSGDHENAGYNEVQAMKDYAVERGVPSENIFMDHAGLSTYESMERAKKIFLVEHPIIVTQAYHLYRAIYLADSVGMNSIGADATLQDYDGQSGRDVREILARSKDFFSAMFQPNMYYGGDQIPISGNGNVTND